MRRPIRFSVDLLRGSMVALLFGSLLAWATLPWSRADRRVAGSGTIVVYGASNFEPAINGELVDAFRSRWQAESGERIEVITAFGGSGTVTNRSSSGRRRTSRSSPRSWMPGA